MLIITKNSDKARWVRSGTIRQDKTRRHPDKKVSPGFEKNSHFLRIHNIGVVQVVDIIPHGSQGPYELLQNGISSYGIEFVHQKNLISAQEAFSPF